MKKNIVIRVRWMDRVINFLNGQGVEAWEFDTGYVQVKGVSENELEELMSGRFWYRIV